MDRMDKMRNNVNKNLNIAPKSDKSQNIRILTILISIIVIIIMVYLIAMTVKYFLTPCYKRKNYFSYIFGFCWNKVCDQDIESSMEIYTQSGPTENPHIEPQNIIEEVIEEVETSLEPEQVFHISNQDYTYEQAKCKCNSYGSKLATKEEITKAYNNGADWCSYGWSEGQTAYYPTQKCTWDKLQKGNSKDKNSCGKPGVNGGFFANTHLKFGANCYGKKPKGEVVVAKKPHCSFKNFCKLSQNYGSSHQLPSDEIAPFNSDQWDQ